MKRNKSFSSSNCLYLIATPIGNLKEFSPRAVEVVSDCDYVAAEDTRNSGLLLNKFNISKQFISLREHNEKSESAYIVDLIKQGKKVVYMSDAGYPGISDPGTILVKECIANDIPVSFVSGSSAFIGALVCSGLDTSHFYFEGFLSAKNSEAICRLEELKDKKETLIFYESPHRIMESLQNLNNVFGDREIVICRELTKVNEEFIRLTLDEISSLDEQSLKGEMVIVVAGNKEVEEFPIQEVKNHLQFLMQKGLTKKDAVEIVSTLLKLNKNQVYKLVK